MFTRRSSRPMTTALTLALLAITACGGQGEGLFGKNKKSLRGSADGVSDQGDVPIDGGSLSLTMPEGHAQFANVATIEISVWSAATLVQEATICQASSPPRCYDQTGKYLPGVTSPSPSTGQGAPIVRRVAYKAGEKVNVSDIPAGPVEIKIDMLDKDNKVLFVGRGDAQVQKGATATAIVYVSPTAVQGSVSISILPAPTVAVCGPYVPHK